MNPTTEAPRAQASCAIAAGRLPRLGPYLLVAALVWAGCQAADKQPIGEGKGASQGDGDGDGDLDADAAVDEVPLPEPVVSGGRDAGANAILRPVCEGEGEPCECDGVQSGEVACDGLGRVGCNCPADPICWPGQVSACECDDGGAGTRQCEQSALAYSDCACAEHLEDGYRLPDSVACAIQRKCSRCHGAPLSNDAPMPLVTWEDFHAPTPSQPEVPVYIWLGDRAGRDDALRMPPPGSRAVSQAERNVLLAWVAQGAPPAGPPPPDPDPPSGPPLDAMIPESVSTTLERTCWTCHGEVLQFGAPMPLRTTEDFHAPVLTDPSAKVYERVIDRLTRTDGTQMPPPGSVPWSIGMRDILLEWVGAPPLPAPEEDCSPLL